MAEEAKALGISARVLDQWIRDNTGTGKLSDKWKEYKLEYGHRIQMTTRDGKKQRRIELDKIRADMEGRGLPRRGQYAWNAFLSQYGSCRMDTIRDKVVEWLSKLPPPPNAHTHPDQPKSTTPRTRRSRGSEEAGRQRAGGVEGEKPSPGEG